MRKWVGCLLVIALLVIAHAATAGTPAAKAPATSKSTLVVSSFADPRTLNPYANDSRTGMRVYFQVYERLINRDPNKPGEYVGVLAESWQVANDGRSITFKIRKGVKFHNGAELKASDVVFSLKTMGQYPNTSAGEEYIDYKGARATDDYTVVLPLTYKCSLALVALANTNHIIVNEKWWTAAGDKVATTANGTAKMMIKDGDYRLNSQVTFTRFDGYWGTPAALEKIIMRFIPESSQAAIELETGAIDVVQDVAAVDYKRIDGSATMKLMQFPSNVNDFLNFLTTDKVFSDVRVRRAVAYAMNAEDYFKAVYLGWGRVAYGAITPDVAFYSNEFEGSRWPYKQDVEKAKALLKEAGYPNGITFDLWVDQDGNRQKVAEILKNQLAKAGMTMNIRQTESSSRDQKLAEGTAQAFLNGINANTMEPDRALYVRWNKAQAVRNGTNHTRWVNDEFSKAIDDARQTFDSAEKARLYKRAQQIIVDQVPSIPYYVRMQVIGANKKLKGVVPYGEAYNFFDAYFE